MDKEFISGSQGRIIGEVISKDSSITSARPTGQGFGAARKGPAVQGKIEAVSDAAYPQGESFEIGGVKSSPIAGVK